MEIVIETMHRGHSVYIYINLCYLFFRLPLQYLAVPSHAAAVTTDWAGIHTRLVCGVVRPAVAWAVQPSQMNAGKMGFGRARSADGIELIQI